MALYFLDSSGLVKRYIAETGSAWIRDVCDPVTGNQIYIAQVPGAEVVAAITRRQRQGSLSASRATAAVDDFRVDFKTSLYVIEISTALINRAMDIAEKHALRGYDAIQLAACLYLRDRCRVLELPEPIVVSADVELNSAAQEEGLAVENPNSYT